MTKYQISVEVFIVVLFQKISGQTYLFSFLKETTIKTSADIWCLVIGFWSMAYPMERTQNSPLRLTDLYWDGGTGGEPEVDLIFGRSVNPFPTNGGRS
jgi:hypothetical protein